MEAKPDKYAETEEVLEQVVGVFSERGDIASVRESGRILCEMQEAVEARHAEILQSIKELASQTQRAKQQHAERQSKLLGSAQKENLLCEQDRVQQNVDRLRQETLALKEQIGSVQGRTSELGAREQQVRQQESVEVPRARHTVSLYANISSIRWDYSSSLVKGFMTSANGTDIKSFELDPAQHSNFFIANKLWELMDAP